MWRNIKLSWN